MKKNFFKKKLASGLAIALVVASISVPNYASAASATKVVNQGGKTATTVLYVGGDKVDYGLSKTYAGNTYTWTTSDSSIATISKAGVVTAVKPGTVTIKATARDSKGKWLAAFTQKLTVNLRATSVDVASDDFSLYVNETKDLNAVKTPSNSTDAVRYYSDNTAVATVDAKTGVVKAVGVGEATITVYSKATYKSATASKYNKTDSVKVTVVDGIQTVKQTVADVLELTFATDQSSKLTASNLTITDADGVKQTISDIDFSTDGKTATVTTYLQFEDGAVYTLTYGDTSKTFTASNGDVASVKLTSATVQYETNTDLEYAAYDKNGVDVSENVDWESDVDFDYDESDAEIGWDLDNDGDDVYQIEAYDYPDTIDVEMTYTYYDEDASESKEYTAKATIKSVEEIAKTASDIQYTITDDTLNDDIDWDDDELESTIKADSEDLQLFISATDENGDDITESDFDKFVSTDEDIVTVSYDEDDLDDDDTATPIYIYPVDEGTAYIKATRGDTVKLLKVTVGSEAEAKSIKIDDSSIELYSPFQGSTHGVTVDVDVLDQYGDEMDYDDDADVDFKSGPVTESASPIYFDSDEDEVTFYLNSAVTSTNDGTYTYKITLEDKTVSVSIKVIDVDETNTTIKSLELVADDSDNAVDVAMEYGDDADDAAVVNYTLYAINSDGDRFDIVTGDASYTLYLDGDVVSDYSDEGFDFVKATTSDTATFTAVDFQAASPVVTQASVGTYKIKATYTDATNATKTTTQTLKVTNSQEALSVTRDEQTLSASDDGISTVADVLDEAFTIKYDGDEQTAYADVDAVVDSKSVGLTGTVKSGSSVRIKSVTIKYFLDATHYVEIEVDVNKTVTIKE